MVVKHQQDAGDSENNEKIKSNAAHSPGVVVTDGVAVNFGGMEVQKNIREHAQGAAALAVIMLDPEDGFVKLGLLRLLERLDFLFHPFLQDLGVPAKLLNETHRLFLFRQFGIYAISHSPPDISNSYCATSGKQSRLVLAYHLLVSPCSLLSITRCCISLAICGSTSLTALSGQSKGHYFLDRKST